MADCFVLNVCFLGGNDTLQNVLQIPTDICWEDFELLVSQLPFQCNFKFWPVVALVGGVFLEKAKPCPLVITFEAQLDRCVR